MRAAVLVLGDIGRSPRMLYHALSLAANNITVDLIGHAGHPAPDELERHPKILIHRLPAQGGRAANSSRPLFYIMTIWRVVREAASLLGLLGRQLPRPDVILVQTPPSVPTLAIAWLIARSRGSRLVIDWHNFGDRMLALRLGHDSRLVRLMGALERLCARGGDAHLVVSDAMREVLVRDWQLDPVAVLHDRPAERFRPLSATEKSAARQELLERANLSADDNRPILISPTSWTLDEDFDLLLAALADYEGAAANGELLVMLTGDGPGRKGFERQAAALGLQKVRIKTAWFDSDDYPRALGAADLGLCLHRSASGVDLPMKIMDCLGSGLPVLALDYGPCIREAITPGEEGLLFRDARELSAQLREVGDPQHGARRVNELGARVAQALAAGEPWQQAWARDARPVVLPDLQKPPPA